MSERLGGVGEGMVRVFVYGTLKRGYGNNPILLSSGGRYLHNGVLVGARIYDLGYYPGVKLTQDEGERVKGELWEVPEKGMAHLDRLEGVPYLYHRSIVSIYSPEMDSTTFPVVVYEYTRPVDEGKLLPLGEWPAVMKGRV
jgi:gamma-glutamylaminecyclotransferase